MTERLTRRQIQALGEDGWRVYTSEAVSYDYLAVREIDGRTTTKRIKRKSAPSDKVLGYLDRGGYDE